MITVYEVVAYRQSDILRRIEKVWGPIKVEVRRDPEDDYPEFEFYRNLMQQKPRG